MQDSTFDTRPASLEIQLDRVTSLQQKRSHLLAALASVAATDEAGVKRYRDALAALDAAISRAAKGLAR